MKKIIFSIALCGLLFACKKETVQTTEVKPDSTTVVTTTEQSTMNDNWDARMEKAEADLKAAKDKLAEATKSGDEKAKAAAQKTADEATAAWEKLKLDVKDATDKTKEKLGALKDTAKVKYNEALEKAESEVSKPNYKIKKPDSMNRVFISSKSNYYASNGRIET